MRHKVRVGLGIFIVAQRSCPHGILERNDEDNNEMKLNLICPRPCCSSKNFRGVFEHTGADPLQWPKDRLVMFYIIKTIEYKDDLHQFTKEFSMVPICLVSKCLGFTMNLSINSSKDKSSLWNYASFQKRIFSSSN